MYFVVYINADTICDLVDINSIDWRNNTQFKEAGSEVICECRIHNTMGENKLSGYHGH